MRRSTIRLLTPIVAVAIQNNSASTLIPPYLDGLHIPVAVVGSLISLGPVFSLLSRLPVGMAYRRGRSRSLLSIALLATGVTNCFYGFAGDALTFAIVHVLNGFAFGAVTTLYLAFYVDSLEPGENRNHAMGYYVGGLALGYSAGGFIGGWVADHWGYALTFQLAGALSLVSVGLLWTLHERDGTAMEMVKPKAREPLTIKKALAALLEPELAVVLIVALFLNLLHQMSSVFISLYGLSVGMSLTQIGVIRGAFAGCNAVTRPISGHVVNKIGHKNLSYFGLPLQACILAFIPLFTGFYSVLIVYVASGAMRAVVIVANAVGLVQDVPENKVQRGLASGVYNAFGDLGNIMGPPIGGLIAQAAGIGSVFIVGSLASTILFFGAIVLARTLNERRLGASISD